MSPAAVDWSALDGVVAAAHRGNQFDGTFEQQAALLAEDGPVIGVSCDRTEVNRISGLRNVIPVHLSTTHASNVLCDGGSVCIGKLQSLAGLFADGMQGALLQLASQRPSDLRDAQQKALAAQRARIEAAGGLSIYGAGNIGRQAFNAARLANLPVACFIDRHPARVGTMLCDVPIYPPSGLVSNQSVVVIALGRGVAGVREALSTLGVTTFVGLSELYAMSRSAGEPETDYLDDLFANRWRYLSLFLMLEDNRSRRILEAVVMHRLSLSQDPLIAVCEHGHSQWFDPDILPRNVNDVFVDGGAYDGDTVAGYVAARGMGYRAIHAFELDPELVAAGRRNTAALANVTIHNIGLSDRPGEVLYRRTGGTDGSIGALSQIAVADKGSRVAIGRIDDIVREPITFLKLDVEGEEARVLAGALSQIRENRPTLAVAVYHKAQDLWDIPRRILAMEPSYSLRLNHYTDCAYETVIYAQSSQKPKCSD